MNFYVVDDDPDVLTLLTRLLEAAGHRVEASPSSLRGAEADPDVAPRLRASPT